ncbi:hypothetical protein M115_1288, partial [Bacteroides fragilis str. 3719 T6]
MSFLIVFLLPRLSSMTVSPKMSFLIVFLLPRLSSMTVSPK